MRGTLRVVAGAALVVAVALAVVAALVGAPWLWAVVAACAVVGVAAGAVALGASRSSARTGGRASDPVPGAPAVEPAGPAVRDVDDLPAFFAAPPGSPVPSTPPTAPTAVEGTVPAPAATPAATPPEPVGPSARGTGGGRRRTGVLAALGVLVVVGGVVAATALVSSRTPAAETSTGTATPGSRPAGTAGTSHGAPSSGTRPAPTTPPAPLTAAAAGGLAGVDLPPGDDGFTAVLTFPGVVLEPRAVGVTVAYPVLTVDSDGASTVAHLDLAVWNCLAGTPPTDPVAAQCSRSLEEHADLGSPDLGVARRGDAADLTGTFATYTRPNGSPPAYTGRSYPVTATLTARTGPGGVAGSLVLGGTRVDATGEGGFSG